MTADVASQRKWFRRVRSPGGLVIGDDAVKIAYGDPVDQAINYDGSNGKYRVSQTGQIISGDNLVKTENWDAANHMAIHTGGQNYHNQQSYGKLREEGDEQFEQLRRQQNRMEGSRNRIQNSYPAPESSGFTFVMKERDCLDATFDGIETYGCKDSAGEIFAAGVPPLSPEASYELQKALDGRLISCDATGVMEEKVDADNIIEEKDCIDNTFDGIENYSCSDTTGEIFPDGVDHLSPTAANELQRTLDGNFLSCGTDNYERTSNSSDPVPTGFCSANKPGEGFGFMASVIVERLLARENQSPNKTKEDQNTIANSYKNDLEQNGDLNSDAHALRINRENSIIDVESLSAPEDEESKRKRLEQLRQNKRAIEERQRLGFGKNQTIVIARDDIYEKNEEFDEESDSKKRVSKLQVGSSVTEKQTKSYYLCRKFAFVATSLLISVGVVIFAVALFWPARQL